MCFHHSSRRQRRTSGPIAGSGECIWAHIAQAVMKLTLQKYHVPEVTKGLLRHYFDLFVDAWQRQEVSLMTRRTISTVLFAAALKYNLYQ